MILSRHQIGLLPADTDDDLIETARAYHDAMDEVERLRADQGKHLSWAIFAVRDHDAYAQPFVLMRDTDVSGVSGTGVVADGVAFPDGTVALRWRGGNPTSVVFHDNGVESVEKIHGHGGATRLVWLAESLETTAEVAEVYDERDAARAEVAAIAESHREWERKANTYRAELDRLVLVQDGWDAMRNATVAERDAARAELSALRDRIMALHVECTCCAPPTCNECTSLTYPCATVRLLEGNSDD